MPGDVKKNLRYSFRVDVIVDPETGAMQAHIHNIEDGVDICKSAMTGFDCQSALAIGHTILEDARLEYEVAARAKKATQWRRLRSPD